MYLEPLTPKGNAFFSDFKLNGARWAIYLGLEATVYLYLNTKSGEALLKNLSARYIPYPRPLLLFASALSLLTLETTLLRAALSLVEQPGKAPSPPSQEKPKPVLRSIPKNNNSAKESEALVDIYCALFSEKPNEKATDYKLVEAILVGITAHRDQLVEIFTAVNQEGGGVLPKTQNTIIGQRILAAIEALKNKPFVGGNEEV